MCNVNKIIKLEKIIYVYIKVNQIIKFNSLRIMVAIFALFILIHLHFADGCVQTIINNAFDDRDVLYMFNEYYNDDIIIQLRPYVVMNLSQTDKNVRFNISPKNVVVFTKDDQDFFEMFELYRNSSLWNVRCSPRKKYLIFFEAKSNVSKIFKYLQNLQVVQVYIFEKQENNSWNYYVLNRFCNINSSQHFFNCNNTKSNFYDYRDKIKNCSPTITYIKSGFSNTLLKPLEIFRKLFKVTTKLIIPSHNDENWFLAGVENVPRLEMYKHDVIIATPGRFLNSSRFFEFSDIILRDSYIWLLPLPNRIPSIKIFASVFENKVWITMLIVTVAVIIVLVVMSCLNHNHQQYKDKINLAMHVIVLSFGITGLTRLPTYRPMKILLIFYMLYALQISSFFQCHLSGFLIRPSYEEKLENVEKVSNSQLLPIVFSIGLRNVIRDYKSLNISGICDRVMLNFTNYENTKELLYKRKGITVCIPKSNLTDKDAIYTYNVPFQHFFTPEFAYLIKHGSYYLDYLNKAISIAHENGFSFKWFYANLNKKLLSAHNNDVVLSLNHLQAAFKIYLYGSIISLTIFFCELLFIKIKFYVEIRESI